MASHARRQYLYSYRREKLKFHKTFPVRLTVDGRRDGCRTRDHQKHEDIYVTYISHSGSRIVWWFPRQRSREASLCYIGLPCLLGRESDSSVWVRIRRTATHYQYPPTMRGLFHRPYCGDWGEYHTVEWVSLFSDHRSHVLFSSCLLVLVPTSSSLLNLWPSWRCFSDIHD
jgi:hypothetical protein